MGFSQKIKEGGGREKTLLWMNRSPKKTDWERTVYGTWSRGDVFVVRTSKAVENLWKNGLFCSLHSFVTHSIDRKPRDWGFAVSALPASVAFRATCRAPARIWLAVMDFQNRSEEIVYNRFIKIPLGQLIVLSDRYRHFSRWDEISNSFIHTNKVYKEEHMCMMSMWYYKRNPCGV